LIEFWIKATRFSGAIDMPYTPLTSQQVDDIASRYFAKREKISFAQEQPTIVLVAAQPGAGKSAAATIARNAFIKQGGYIHVDADRMRERIPIGGSRPTSEQTQPDAARLVTTLRWLAIEGRRNIVEEGTFRNHGVMAETIEKMHRQGYKVELLAVATSREESQLGIY
jgi:predicted ABC-type ATPase